MILVGHSYAGMVITGVAAREPHRLRHLVYLDADLPDHGQSRFDLQPEARAWWEQEATRGDGWRVNLDLPEEALLEIMPDAAIRKWYLDHSNGQGHPIQTLSQPVQTTGGEGVPRTFIGCTEDAFGMRSGLYGRMARIAQSSSQFQVLEVAATHFAPVTHPVLVAEALLSVAASSSI